MVAEFKTIPEELIEAAVAFIADVNDRGYTVKVEPRELELPGTPLFKASRQNEILYGLVLDRFDSRKIDQWLRYSQSGHRDTRVCILVRQMKTVTQKRSLFLREQGIGLVKFYGKKINVVFESKDLAFKAQLPHRSDLKPPVRKLLGESFDRFDSKDWKVGFEDACLVLEDECKTYLKKKIRLGPVSFTHGGKPKNLTDQIVNRATLGKMKDIFCSLIKQNQIDSQLCHALKKLNPNRIRQVHKRRRAQSEAALRRQVGPQMWLIANVLQLMH